MLYVLFRDFVMLNVNFSEFEMIIILFILVKKFKCNEDSYLNSINVFVGLFLEFVFVDGFVGSFLYIGVIRLVLSIEIGVGISDFWNNFF